MDDISAKISFILTRLNEQRLALFIGAGLPASEAGLPSGSRLRDLLAGALGDDDLTFSGGNGLVGMLPLIRTIVKEEGFELNDSKTRVMRNHKRQEVTGLVVNSSVAVGRSRVRWLRQQLYYLQKFGPQNCSKWTHTPQKNRREFFYGHALFVKMVDVQRGTDFLTRLDSIEW